MFLASVNGGVWRTIDGGTTWKPLTDQLPSLSIGAIAIAAKDKDGSVVNGATALDKLVVFAGTGSFSSFDSRGGFPVGLFKSLDGGDTWSVMASDQLSQIKISAIVASDKDNVVATGYGGAASTSWALAYNATAAQVKAALEALPNIGVGNVDVTGGALPGTALTITFRGTLTKRDVPNLIATSSLTGGATPAITITTVDGKAGTTSEVQTLTISGTPTGGTFTLRFGDVLGGVFRSTDGAATFTRVVAGAATDLVADPGKAGRLYAGIAESGVYRSDDAGVSWKRFDTGLTLANPLDQVDNDGNGILNDLGETGAGAARIRLAIQQNVAATDLAPNTVYAAIIASALMGIFYSTPILTGATAADWTQSAWALLGPVDAVAPAPVSGTLNKYATTASVTFAGATITRTTGDWRTDGFALGQAVTVAGATVPANNGSWRIADVTDTVLTLTGAAFGAAHANAVAFAATSTAAAIPGVTITSGLTTAGVLEWPPSNPKQQPQINLGEQGNLHVGFVADGKGNVFISGDISLSTAGYPAGLFLWNKAAGTWTQLVDQTTTTGIVRPHADVRALILDPDGAPGRNGANFGKLLMATDGGVWSLDLTTTPNRLFTSLNGGGTNGSGALRISEVLSAAYDELNALVFGGAQDNGSYEQLAVASDGLDSNANGLIDDLGERITWRSTSGGDGNTGLAIPLDTDGNVLYDHVLHIVGSNNLTYFTESLYAANGTRLSHGWPATFGSAGPNIAVTGLLLSGQYSGPTASLSNDEVFLLAGSNTPYYLELLGDVAGTSTFYLRQFSPTGPRQLATVAGATTLQKVTVLGGVSAADAAFTGFNYIPMAVNAVAPNQVVVGMTSLYESTNYLATISATPLNDRAWTALAYGGKIAGVADPTALYAAEGNNVWVRYAGHALAAEPLAGATSIRSVVLDPRDARGRVRRDRHRHLQARRDDRSLVPDLAEALQRELPVGRVRPRRDRGHRRPARRNRRRDLPRVQPRRRRRVDALRAQSAERPRHRDPRRRGELVGGLQRCESAREQSARRGDAGTRNLDDSGP